MELSLPTARHLLDGPRTGGRRRVNWVFVVLCAGCALVVPVLIVLGLGSWGRVAVAAAVAFPLVVLAAVNARLAVTATLVFLVLVGDLRRMLIPLVGWAGLDPLLLLGPALAILLAAGALGTGAIRLDTRLSRWVAALMAVMVVQIFNPLQGGLAVGVAGVIFLMAPLFWFWVGRTYATPAYAERLLLYVVLPLGLVATVFGYYQQFAGYLPYQLTWYYLAGYTALGTPEGGLAPITFFASATEHGGFLVTTGIVLWAVFLTRKARAAAFLVLPILIALVLTGSRGPVVKLVVMMAVMWAVLGRTRAAWVPRFALALLVLGAGVVWSVLGASATGFSPAIQGSLDRQAMLFSGEELRGDGYNTVAVHSTLLSHGYLAAVRQPLGYGLGATSNAAAKFGQAARPTETDVGDVMMATGFVGGVIYHGIIVLIVLAAVRYWRRSRGMLALAILGILGAHSLMWLGGGLYAVSALTWLFIGGLDRADRDLRAAPVPIPPGQ